MHVLMCMYTHNRMRCFRPRQSVSRSFKVAVRRLLFKSTCLLLKSTYLLLKSTCLLLKSTYLLLKSTYLLLKSAYLLLIYLLLKSTYSYCTAMQVARALPNAMAEDKRISLTCSLDGSIEDIEPHESQLFGWPASEMKARHIADVSLDTQKLSQFWLKCFLATFSACLIVCVQHHTD